MVETNFRKWMKKLSQEKKESLIKRTEEDAYYNEKNYYGCARCVLSALQQNFQGIGNGEAFKASLALAGGVARNCEVCGALLGGLMGVGMAYGTEKLAFPFGAHVKGKEQDDEVAERYSDVMERADKICDKFRDTYGSLRCADVQKAIHDGKFWDLREPNQLKEYLQPEIHDLCANVAGTTARITAKVLLE